MSEFTGERLIPGEVDQDLWNEHISRYAFAASLCTGKEHVVDAGCGTGYGSSLLACASASVLGFDIAPDAIDFALSRYASERIQFCQGSCESIPAPDGSADLITAFEVIEHLAGWREFLIESRRVLKSSGLLLVSTPNRHDYNEARGTAGPNPFHVHEFDYDEFWRELAGVFPHMRLLGQNHGNSVLFCGDSQPNGVAQFARSSAAVPDAAFFLAVCGAEPIPSIANFVYVPEAANVLRDRERHIRILQNEYAELVAIHRATDLALRSANEWAARLNKKLDDEGRTIRELQQELETSNRWAGSLNEQIAEQNKTIGGLQEELASAQAWAQDLSRELSERIARVLQLQAELAEQQSAAQTALQEAEHVIEERTHWALQRDAEYGKAMELVEARTRWALGLEAELRAAEAEVARMHASRWVRAGSQFRLGPRLQ